MLNRIVLIGRLTRDPDVRYTSNSIAVANMRIAVERTFKNAQGERETDFIDVIAWRKLAEIAKQYMVKGQLVAVDGTLQMRTWQTKEGESRTTYEVVADNMRMLERSDRPRSSGPAESGPPLEEREPPPGREREAAGGTASGTGFDDKDDDLPF